MGYIYRWADQMTPLTHPLPDGRYTAQYVISRGRKNMMTEGDLLVAHGIWMLVQEWNVYEDKTEAPKSWFEVPKLSPYSKVKEGSSFVIHLHQPVRPEMNQTIQRAIFPSPPSPPES